MSISIPALVDSQLAALRASMEPTADDSSPRPPHGFAARMADMLRTLTDLVDALGLTVVSGDYTSLTDTGAFTGVNSLVGSRVRFDPATLTTALQGLEVPIVANTVHKLTFDPVQGLPSNADVALLGNADQTFPFNETTGQTLVVKGSADGGATWTAFTRTFTFSTTGSAFANIAALVAELNTAGKWNGGTLPTQFTITASGNKLLITPALTGRLNGIQVAAASTAIGATTDADLLFTGDAYDVGTHVPRVGDTYDVLFAPADADLGVLNAKSLADAKANVHGEGPLMVNALMTLLQRLGASVPSYLSAAAAEPFGIGSPHVGGGAQGHSSLALFSAALQAVRNAVAAYTAPA